MTDAPIGVFDSGVGGLTVARAIMDMMPNESIHYVGDTTHGPYGPLPIADVRQPRARHHGLAGRRRGEDAGHRVQHGVGRGAARRARALRKERGVPVVEVIVPAVRRAAALSRNAPRGRDRHRRDHHVGRLRRRPRRRRRTSP